jgi:hypothetical protein
MFFFKVLKIKSVLSVCAPTVSKFKLVLLETGISDAASGKISKNSKCRKNRSKQEL